MSNPLQAAPFAVEFVLLHRFTLLPFAAFVDCLQPGSGYSEEC